MIYKISLIALLLITTPVYAQGPLNAGDEPIEISAGQALEWHQKDQQYIARGDVVVTQGTTTIKSSELVADYREGATSNTEIWQLTATGNVIISDAENTVTGDKGVYNVEQGLATVTGDNLTLTSPGQVITATQRMEYSSINGKASAIGDAKVVRGDDTLTANTLTAYFSQNESGKNALSKIEANTNVKIVTPLETLTGDNGVYDALLDTATVTGNVKIIRGPNTLEGSRAVVNLTSKISRIFGNEKSGQRVKGVFFPSSNKTQSAQ
ncbi:MAG: ostA-like family protein [Alphaproteobacteria bacterium]|nr:ostA-like family protein [Alphaproteobacteria bacterium]NCQ88595.1 ostA-like family protein [Alphaproteobacteria bacterium]NCT06138.1 ostA-like family protein [Alphaproteobacteria bacterium]